MFEYEIASWITCPKFTLNGIYHRFFLIYVLLASSLTRFSFALDTCSLSPAFSSFSLSFLSPHRAATT